MSLAYFSANLSFLFCALDVLVAALAAGILFVILYVAHTSPTTLQHTFVSVSILAVNDDDVGGAGELAVLVIAGLFLIQICTQLAATASQQLESAESRRTKKFSEHFPLNNPSTDKKISYFIQKERDVSILADLVEYAGDKL